MRAIVYIPGLGYDYFDISGHDYALRMKSAMDKMNPESKKKYSLERKDIKYGVENNFNSHVTSVFEYEENPDSKEEIFRVYEFYYADSLTTRFKNQNIIKRLFLIVFSLFTKSFILFRTLFSEQHLNFKKRLEAIYFFSALGLIALFAILLFPSLIATLITTYESTFDTESSLINQNWIKDLTYWITIVTAIITTVIPNFKDFVSTISTEFLCLDYYLTTGENKLEIKGKLEALIEKIAEDENYDILELHGYSFGSIIVMDTIFPFGTSPILRVEKEIKNLVTIGCPHDFIRTFYPEYFKNRSTTINSRLDKWYNIYSEIDILSSNFKKDDMRSNGIFKLPKKEIKVNNIFFDLINPESMNFWNHIAIIGIRAHRFFWGVGSDSSNCLSLLIAKQRNIEQNAEI